MITSIAHYIPGYWWVFLIGFPLAALMVFYVVLHIVTQPFQTLLGLIPWEVWFILVLFAMASIEVLHYRQTWMNEGYEKALSDIESANAKENTDAAKGQRTVDDCYTAGGDWDRDLRLCHLPSK